MDISFKNKWGNTPPPSHNEGDDSLVSVGDQAVVWDVYLGFLNDQFIIEFMGWSVYFILIRKNEFKYCSELNFRFIIDFFFIIWGQLVC